MGESKNNKYDEDMQKLNYNIFRNNSFITPKSDTMSLPDFYRDGFMNNNWCDMCKDGRFVHDTYSKKFIDKCCRIFKRSKKRFYSSKHSHMLNSLVTVDHNAEKYLELTCKPLHTHHVSNIRVINNATKLFIIEGLVNQYIERKINTCSTLFKATNRDDWLIFNNQRCQSCKMLTCPFHSDMGGFESINNKYCCGWCVEKNKLF